MRVMDLNRFRRSGRRHAGAVAVFVLVVLLLVPDVSEPVGVRRKGRGFQSCFNGRRPGSFRHHSGIRSHEDVHGLADNRCGKTSDH